jgi:hypothetical protein
MRIRWVLVALSLILGLGTFLAPGADAKAQASPVVCDRIDQTIFTVAVAAIMVPGLPVVLPVAPDVSAPIVVGTVARAIRQAAYLGAGC